MQDYVEVVPVDMLSDREGSNGSSTSNEAQDSKSYHVVAPSTEFTPVETPAESRAISPVSENSEEHRLATKQIDSGPTLGPSHRLARDAEDEIENSYELAEADEAEDADDLEDADDAGRLDGDGKVRRRLAGRRRADHPDPWVEAHIRYQQMIKSEWRKIARAQKMALAEIATKTIESLEANHHLHEEVLEYLGDAKYLGVQSQLDQHFKQRKARIGAQLKFGRMQLQKTLRCETQVRRSRFELRAEDLRQIQLDRLDHDLLTFSRQAQITNGSDGNETEDEDNDVILAPKGMSYRFKRANALDSKYDSRSRLAMESEKAVSELDIRLAMQKVLQEVQDTDEVQRPASFTVMDNAARQAAKARKESARNVNVLAEAADEVERIANIPIIANEEAIGLQLLGDLASRPSIRAAIPSKPAPMQPTPHSADFSRMPPPLLGPPFAYNTPPHELSPRVPRANGGFDFSPSFRHGDAHPPLREAGSMPSPKWHAAPSPHHVSERDRRHETQPPPRRAHFDPVADSVGQATAAAEASMHKRHRSEDQARESFVRPRHAEHTTSRHPSTERPLHDFSRGGPLSIARVDNSDELERRSDGLSNEKGRDHSRVEPARTVTTRPDPSQLYAEAPSSPGAADVSRANDPPLDPQLAALSTIGPHASLTRDKNSAPAPSKQRSRASSTVSHSTTTEPSREDSSLLDPALRRPSQEPSQGGRKPKSSKRERGGKSRNQAKSLEKLRRKSEVNMPPAADKNGVHFGRYRLSAPGPTQAQQSTPATGPTRFHNPSNWMGPHGAVDTPPQPGARLSSQAPPPGLPPVPPAGYPWHAPYDYGQHRSSFATTEAGPPAWLLQGPGQSPHYAGQQPPGLPRRPYEAFPPPPPWMYGPPGPAMPPQGQSPQQYGGQPIAPATHDHRTAPGNGGRPDNVSAFAQLQRHQDNHNRRRTQSDVQAKFVNWAPKGR